MFYLLIRIQKGENWIASINRALIWFDGQTEQRGFELRRLFPWHVFLWIRVELIRWDEGVPHMAGEAKSGDTAEWMDSRNQVAYADVVSRHLSPPLCASMWHIHFSALADPFVGRTNRWQHRLPYYVMYAQHMTRKIQQRETKFQISTELYIFNSAKINFWLSKKHIKNSKLTRIQRPNLPQVPYLIKRRPFLCL